MNFYEKFVIAVLIAFLIAGISVAVAYAAPDEKPSTIPWYCHLWPDASGCWKTFTVSDTGCDLAGCWIKTPTGRKINVTGSVVRAVEVACVFRNPIPTCRFFGPVWGGYTAVKGCR